ncbi:hypothetical protein OESDEN_10072 [Oesophagostomum dentatum]|uniref:Uncharacterized protein n=1 Tax=Oesophagostomum dentatum TaxID=61180 RepID=A0A0B1T2T6_OESDE|nr:hypothetical protein OESDEN_10072 [Oesophagostomum dentatum]
MIHSASIIPKDATGGLLDEPHFQYSFILAALLRKNELYKLARQLPFNFDEERMLLRMPPNYGFITPRYVVMRIDMCHKIIDESIPSRSLPPCNSNRGLQTTNAATIPPINLRGEPVSCCQELLFHCEPYTTLSRLLYRFVR